MKRAIFVYILLFSQVGFARGVASSPAVVHAGPGFFVGASVANPGVGASFAGRFFRSLSGLYFGIETGLFAQTSPSFAFLIPALATGFYRFQTNGSLTPTIGAAFGPVFSLGGGRPFSDFMLMVNPGSQLNVNMQTDLFFRLSFGVVGGTFTFYPHFGLVFKL